MVTLHNSRLQAGVNKLSVSPVAIIRKEQADTHHQEGKKNDPTAPDVCFPPVILLSLRTGECFVSGRSVSVA